MHPPGKNWETSVSVYHGRPEKGSPFLLPPAMCAIRQSRREYSFWRISFWQAAYLGEKLTISRSFMNRFLADSAFREEFTSQLRDKTILFRLRGNTLSRTIPYQKNLKFRLKILPKNNIIKKSRCKRKVMCFYYDVKSDKKGVPL